jgi:hypothetical protein
MNVKGKMISIGIDVHISPANSTIFMFTISTYLHLILDRCQMKFRPGHDLQKCTLHDVIFDLLLPVINLRIVLVICTCHIKSKPLR